MVAKPPQGGLWTGSPQASRGLFLGLGPLFLFAVLNLIRPCPFLASLNGFTSLYVRLLLILCVTGYCEIFILFRNHYKLGYDHYGQRIIGDLVLTLRSHEILTYDLLAIGIDMGPDNIVPL